MNCYRASGLSRNAIRNYVHKLRKMIGLENVLYFPIIPFFESVLPVIVPSFNYEILSFEKMANKHGETFPSKNLIQIREDVYVRAAEGEGRDRLTIAHEIGHLLLHDERNISLCRLEQNESLPAYADPEWQANAFGGELLASSYLIKGMNPYEISLKCGVTFSAAQTQLNVLYRRSI